MKLTIPHREVVIGSPHFRPMSCGQHTAQRIKHFQTPQALLAYWNQKTVRERVKALPERYRARLEQRFQERLAELNNSGPDRY